MSGGLPPELSRQLGDIYSKYPSSACQCEKNAYTALDAFKNAGMNGEVIQITAGTPNITDAGGNVIGEGFHQAVQVGDRFFDALTYEAGMENGATWEEYIKLFETPNSIERTPVRPYYPSEEMEP